MTKEHLAQIEDANDLLGRNGERVLAFAMSYLDSSQYPVGFTFDPNMALEGFTFIGLISMQDPPRGRVPWAVT
jgi:sodium/potassium-transporting ATPase subunit alpha